MPFLENGIAFDEWIPAPKNGSAYKEKINPDKKVAPKIDIYKSDDESHGSKGG